MLWMIRYVLFPIVCTGALVGIPGAGAQEQPVAAGAPAKLDSLLAVKRDVARALHAYRPLLAGRAEDAVVRAGFARLQRGDAAGAVEAFQQALSVQASSAPAHYGLALALYRKGQGRAHGAYAQQAIYHAGQAEALFPAFDGPCRLMGRIYLEVLEDDERATDAYLRALKAGRKTDPEVVRGLASAYLRAGAGGEIDREVADSLLASGQVSELFPVVAQACMAHGLPDLAVQYFGRYISRLPAEDRRLYQDISLIASGKELAAYREAEGDPAARREFLLRFWERRDPDLLTRVNERQLEHYRRVWYARHHFSDAVHPWDRRGEVYVRYGAPDYRSRSGHPTPPMSPEVERVKERIASELYGEEAVEDVSSGPVFPVLTQTNPGMDFTYPLPLDYIAPPEPGMEIEPPPESGEEDEELTVAQKRKPLKPGEDLTFVQWESWVYTRVAGGIEIVFTDEWSGGRFEYAPVPHPDASDADAVRRTSRLVKYSPQMVMLHSVEASPDYYMPGGPETFLDFYYDRANFRGREGKTRVEVYYGIPPEGLSRAAEEDTAFVSAGCAVALFDAASGEALRENDEAAYRMSGRASKGAFIPDQLTLEVAPGTYDLRVQVKDLISGRSGIYKERLEVEDYSGSQLRISDLQLGWKVSTDGGEEKYRKGDVWVIPMSSRSYQKGQNPFVYYEVYNLSRDAFGQSRFQLEYTIQSTPEKARGFGRLLAGIKGLFSGEGKPEVSVSAEQARSETDLREYFELSLQNVKPGVNRLTVTVTDLNTGASVQKTALFRYDE